MKRNYAKIISLENLGKEWVTAMSTPNSKQMNSRVLIPKK